MCTILRYSAARSYNAIHAAAAEVSGQ
jgi:hypothetical protein